MRPRFRFWFFAAWVFLVIVVAFGFWVQAQTIDSLHDTQDIQRRLIEAICEQDPRC